MCRLVLDMVMVKKALQLLSTTMPSHEQNLWLLEASLNRRWKNGYVGVLGSVY